MSVKSVENVVAQFSSLPEKGSKMGFWDDDTMKEERYRAKKGDSHFQGIQRHKNRLFISGAFKKHKAAELYAVTKNGVNQADIDAWGSNVDQDKKPDGNDKVTLAETLNESDALKKRWHAGGLGLCDDILAVALQGDGQSVITFYDISAGFEKLNVEVKRPFKAGACAVTKLPNNYYLLAVWSDSDKDQNGDSLPFHLDFYLSDGPGPGITEFRQTSPNLDFTKDHAFYQKHQGIDLIWEKWDSPNPRLYVAGFYSKNFLPGKGKKADLLPANRKHFGIVVPLKLPEEWGQPVIDPSVIASPEMLIGERKKKRFFCGHAFSFRQKWCHMAAGTCLHVDSNGDLIVYGVSHYVKFTPDHPDHNSFVRCTEFKA